MRRHPSFDQTFVLNEILDSSMIRENPRPIMKQLFASLAATTVFSIALSSAVAADLEIVFDYQSLDAQADTSFKGAFRPIGSVERFAPEMDALVARDAKIELLATGFDWSEGPVWAWRRHSLLFSDVPQNKIYEWKSGEGIRVYAQPSGYTGAKPRGGEPGSNGLTFDANGRLVVCQHGDRRVARENAYGRFDPVAQFYKWRRLNSPNDLVFHSNGDLYFTDPSYGLEGNNDAPTKETPFNGVYRVDKKGEITLLEEELTFPNGIAFSPDEQTLYVAVSDPTHPVIMAYDVKEDGTLNLKTKRVLFDATPLKDAGGKGSTDGLKVDKAGNLWATGPGGVLVLSPKGKHLGTINTGEATANCAWGDDGTVLYMTADMNLCRINTLTMGVGPGF